MGDSIEVPLKDHLFTSARLGFRNWVDEDVEKMAVISGDEEVMEFFPSAQSIDHTRGFIRRMQEMFAERGFCYFAVDRLDDRRFIGFIGLCHQSYEAPFTPCVDIGWRLAKDQWGQGFATEGAQRCLQYAFEDLDLENIKAIASAINLKSIRVMQKIGMSKQLDFVHPVLKGNEMLERCVCYQISRRVGAQ